MPDIFAEPGEPRTCYQTPREYGVVVKAGIHPRYQRAVVQCACGNTFETRSTQPSIHVEICAKCHPYFTGKQKLVDTAGRVERFRQRYKTGPAPETATESKEA